VLDQVHVAFENVALRQLMRLVRHDTEVLDRNAGSGADASDPARRDAERSIARYRFERRIRTREHAAQQVMRPHVRAPPRPDQIDEYQSDCDIENMHSHHPGLGVNARRPASV
jgi:hypothetical protein